jgi:hypothetical protein
MSLSQSLSIEPRPELSALCLATIENSPLPMAAVDGVTHILRYGNPAFCHLMDKPLENWSENSCTNCFRTRTSA